MANKGDVMAAFDFYLNNSERFTALHYNISFNRLLVEDSEERTQVIELAEKNIKNVTLWNGRKMNLEDFINFVCKEVSLTKKSIAISMEK